MKPETKKLRDKIQSFLGQCYEEVNGYGSVNGGYGEFKIKKFKQLPNGKFIVEGYSIVGCDDMGSGRSEKYTDKHKLLIIRIGKDFGIEKSDHDGDWEEDDDDDV